MSINDISAEIKIRAAWMYFVEGLTQEQISKILGVPRLRVIRTLALARHDGTVKIAITAKSAGQVELERALVKLLGVTSAIVVPSHHGPDETASLVGHAAGQWLGAQMHDGTTLAIGWGNTLNFALQGMQSRLCVGSSVVSLMGSMTHSRAINPSAVARRIADLFGADCFQLTAPIFVSNPDISRALFSEPGLQQLQRRAERADLALISVGTIAEDSTLAKEELVSIEEMRSLAEARAVGDVLGRFIDAAGTEIVHPVNSRVMSINLDVVRAIPVVAIASGGRNKAQAIIAAIRASDAKVLITDESAARAIIDAQS